MKKFILIVCGSFVGAFLAFLIFLFAAMIMSFGIMGSMGSSGKKAVSVNKHSILKLDLGTTINERSGGEEIDMMTLLSGDIIPSDLGLNTMISAIENAAEDDKIEGIYIECNGVNAAPATLKQCVVPSRNSRKAASGLQLMVTKESTRPTIIWQVSPIVSI